MSPAASYRFLLKHLGTALAITACLISLNVHLAFLQGLAWGTMLPTYQKESGSVGQALQMTIGGERPCALCEVVSTELLRQATQSEDSTGELAPFHLAFLLIPRETELKLVPPPDTNAYVVNPATECARGREAPLGPPPRV